MEHNNTNTAHYTILLVDDDEFLVDMYALKFTQAGHTIVVASSAEEALEKLADTSFAPDAVLVDLVMPKMDGFELMEAIKQRDLQGHAKLIVLSNQGEQEDIERAKSLGAVGHIIKANAIPSEVLTMVEDLIANTNTTDK